MTTGMAGPSLNPFQQLLQDRVSQLSSEMEKLFREASERSRREFADQLNQAVRRMRLAPDDGELLATLADSAGTMASGAAVFRLKGKVAAGEYVRGVAAAEAEDFRELEIPLESAGALAGAVETRDPVTTITSAGAVSPELMRL